MGLAPASSELSSGPSIRWLEFARVAGSERARVAWVAAVADAFVLLATLSGWVSEMGVERVRGAVIRAGAEARFLPLAPCAGMAGSLFG